KIKAAASGVADVEDAPHLRVELLLVVEIVCAPRDGLAGGRIQTAFSGHWQILVIPGERERQFARGKGTQGPEATRCRNLGTAMCRRSRTKTVATSGSPSLGLHGFARDPRRG